MVVVVNVIIKIGSVKFPLTLISRFIMHFGSQKKKSLVYGETGSQKVDDTCTY